MTKLYRFRVSEVGKCLRFLYLTRVIGRLEDIDSKPEVIAGRKIHAEFQNDYAIFDENARMEEEVMFIHENFVVVGRADIITDDRVIEIKTINSLPAKPYSAHIRQLNFYMRLCGRKKGTLTYIERETGKQKDFSIELDENAFLEDLRRFEKLAKHLRSMSLPKREETGICKFCEYAVICERI